MDRHFDDQGFNETGLKVRPTAWLEHNCCISFEPVERSLSALADYIGPQRACGRIIRIRRLLPWRPEIIVERLEPLSPEVRRQWWRAARGNSTAYLAEACREGKEDTKEAIWRP